MLMNKVKAICVVGDKEENNGLLLEAGKEYIISNLNIRGLENMVEVHLDTSLPYRELYQFELEASSWVTSVFYDELRLPVISQVSINFGNGEVEADFVLTPYGRLEAISPDEVTRRGFFVEPQRLFCEAMNFFGVPKHA